jgi:hypothetical protein
MVFEAGCLSMTRASPLSTTVLNGAARWSSSWIRRWREIEIAVVGIWVSTICVEKMYNVIKTVQNIYRRQHSIYGRQHKKYMTREDMRGTFMKICK